MQGDNMLSSNLNAFADGWGTAAGTSAGNYCVKRLLLSHLCPYVAVEPCTSHPVSWFVKWAYYGKLNNFQSPLYMMTLSIVWYMDKNCQKKHKVCSSDSLLYMHILGYDLKRHGVGAGSIFICPESLLLLFGDSTWLFFEKPPHQTRPIPVSSSRMNPESLWGQPFEETVP